MAHSFKNDPAASTATDVLWRCEICGGEVGFNRQGVGEPWGSETEIPANAGDFVGPCLTDEEVVARKRTAILAKVAQGKKLDPAERSFAQLAAGLEE